jgi:Domain of unknown function (DUF4402)
MTRHILGLITAALALTATPVMAQLSASVPVNATVATRLVVTSTGSTSFGTFDNSAHQELLAPWPASSTQGKTMALFTITADLNRTVVLSCPATMSLSLAGSPSTVMSYTPMFGVGTVLGSLQGSLTGCQGSTATTATGTYYVSLGGVLTVANNQAVGTYSGTFTLSVAY